MGTKAITSNMKRIRSINVRTLKEQHLQDGQRKKRQNDAGISSKPRRKDGSSKREHSGVSSDTEQSAKVRIKKSPSC